MKDTKISAARLLATITRFQIVQLVYNDKSYE